MELIGYISAIIDAARAGKISAEDALALIREKLKE